MDPDRDSNSRAKRAREREVSCILLRVDCESVVMYEFGSEKEIWPPLYAPLSSPALCLYQQVNSDVSQRHQVRFICAMVAKFHVSRAGRCLVAMSSTTIRNEIVGLPGSLHADPPLIGWM